MKRRSLLAGALALGCGQGMNINGLGIDANIGIGFGGNAAAVVPVPGFIQLIDAASGVTYSTGGFIGERFVDSFVPAGGLYVDPYTASSTARPAYELNSFNGFPSICGDGANDVLASTTAAFALAALGGTNTPFIYYISAQFMAAANSVAFAIGNSGNTNNWLEHLAASTGNVLKVFKVDSAGNIATAATSSTNDQLRHVWRVAFDGTNVTVERDGVVVLTTTVFTNAQTITPNLDAFFALKRSTTTNFGFCRINKRLWYSKATETASEKAQNYAYMNAAFTAVTGNCLFNNEGDSTSRLRDGVQAPEPGSWLGLMGLSHATYVNTAVSSQALGPTMLSQQVRDVNSIYPTGYTFDVVALVAGLNDYNNGRTAAQFTADMQTWITSLRTARPSAKIIVATCPKGALITGSKDTERQNGNASVLTNAVSSWGADATCDVDGLLPEATGDTTIRTDGTHWTTLACQRVADNMTSIARGFGCT